MSDLTFAEWEMAFTGVSEMARQHDSTGRICKEYFKGLTLTNQGFHPVTSDEVNQWYRYCCEHGVKHRPSLNEIKRFIRDSRTANQPRLPPAKRTSLGFSQRFYMAILIHIKRGASPFFEQLVSGEDLAGNDHRAFLTGPVPPRSEVVQIAEAIASQFPSSRLEVFREIRLWGERSRDPAIAGEVHQQILNVVTGKSQDAA